MSVFLTVLNMAWTQFMSWEIIKPTTGFVFGLLVFLYAALICSYAGLYKQRYFIRQLDYWLIHLLVNNGIAVYATWVTVAALRSLALNMISFQGIKHEFAVTIGLGILALSMVIWFILENTLLKEHLQYTITIYPVLIWVMAASVIFNLNRVSRISTVIMEALLSMSCTFFLAKFLLLIWSVTQNRRETRAVADLQMSEIPPNTEQKYTNQTHNDSEGVAQWV